MIPELEKEFNKTTKVLLGLELKNLADYEAWLGKHIELPYKGKSAISGKDVWVPPPLNYMKKKFNPSKIISMDEMNLNSKSPFSAKDIEHSSIVELVSKFIRPLAYHCGNFRYQSYENIEECSGAGGGRNIYRCEDVYLNVKNIAFSNYALFCENMFGCYGVSNSKFAIHAYTSTSINRCFEIEGCSNSSDLVFCHNCENVYESMFCFNAKNLKYAVGNVQLPLEKYKKIKALIIKELAEELAKSKTLKLNIFNLGV